jgi:TPP-dependent pyruvate/acetoin dehydrogenase alpha subunit
VTKAEAEIADSLRLSMYRQMVLIRSFEEAVRTLASAGIVPGLVHLCSGQEATNVGICAALKPSDVIASHHRGHGHCLARGARPDWLLAEILGKSAGYCLGRSGSMHIIDLEHGNLGTNGIVGGGIPLATGAALAARTREEDRVAVCFFGDGALNQGLVHECMNMAANWSLPVVFVCENNGYGEFTAMEDVTAGSDITKRGEVFGIPSQRIDGMDVLVVYEAARDAAHRARRGAGPSFLICNTYRFGGHHVGDKQDYKDQAEAEEWLRKDPILKLARLLIETGEARESDLRTIDAEIAEEIRKAVDFAKQAPEPSPDLLEAHLYAK